MSLKLVSMYCPSHFGNYYECAAEGELGAYFQEMRAWGINGIGTWVDPANLCDPFSEDPLYRWGREMPQMLLARKWGLLRAAHRLHMKLTLTMTPNAVYLDQLAPGLAARSSGHDIGPNLCPSNPEARRIILRNCENLLRDLAEQGIPLDYVLAAFRDFGGCACERCHPWAETFVSLWEEIAPILLRYHPNARVQFCTWWVSDDEMEIIRRFLEKKRPEWVEGVNLSLGYGTEIPEITLPQGYQKSLFLHISYGTTHSDKYGVKGAVVAPVRLEHIFRKLVDTDIAGIQAYSEGNFEDLNKFLVGKLAHDPLQDARALVRSYCEHYFELKGRDLEDVADAIFALEDLKPETAEMAADSLARARSRCSDWRLSLLWTRAEVGRLEAEIGSPDIWEAKRQGTSPEAWGSFEERIEVLIQVRRTLLENLERDIYRVGAQCHILNMDLDYRPWQAWRGAFDTQQHPSKGDSW